MNHATSSDATSHEALEPGAGEPLPDLATAEVPISTYRVQFHAGFQFKDATAAVPYWKRLGISHLYASPYLKARKGSTHGYDVVDHDVLNPEVGSQEDYDELCATLKRHGMQQLLDIVPNHMGVLEADNKWWLDVMEHGPHSDYAHVFDIDWASNVAGLSGKVLVGLLGDPYGDVLERGELVVGFKADDGGFSVTYFEHCFPLDPASTVQILNAAPLPSNAEPSQREPLRKLLDGFATLSLPPSPPSPALTPVPMPKPRPRRELALSLRAGLADWVRSTPWALSWIDECLAVMNGRPGDPASFDPLDQLMRAQFWRIAHWRTTGHEVNYRRFFDVNTLAAVRTEKLEVFEATHRTVLRWVDEGRVAGLRIDHPDGLSDPATYLERLQRRHLAAQQARGVAEPKALYVVVEKILGDDETLPSDWLAHGDTGYHYANQVNGVFVDTQAEAAFDHLYQGFVHQAVDYDLTLHEAKYTVMGTSLAADLELLTDELYALARARRRTLDFTRSALHDALAELAASFPVYRTYIGSGTHSGSDPMSARAPSDADARYMAEAVTVARQYALGSAVRAIDYLADLLLNAHAEPDLHRRKQLLHFATRWQQFTSPVMAKSMEDTTFYRYLRLVSLNDVGGDPRRFGMTVADFHAANEERTRISPHTLLGTSTHDTKRSEDVRTRLDVLSEMPELWDAALQRWHVMNDVHAAAVKTMRSSRTPTLQHEYLLYQTLVGAWPLEPQPAFEQHEAWQAFCERVQSYMLKATREAKDATAWMEPDPSYEEGLARFIGQVLDPRHSSGFLSDMQHFVDQLAPFGACNSIGLVALKLTSPGVPDVYQGCETWNLSLVDPDNRRPIDFARLGEQLGTLEAAVGPDGQTRQDVLDDVMEHWRDGRVKMLVHSRLMALRQERRAVFRDGGYLPLQVVGTAAEHVIAYARLPSSGTAHEAPVVTVVARLAWRLSGGDWARLSTGSDWGDTRVVLPDQLVRPEAAGAAADFWVDAITGHAVRARAEAGAEGLGRDLGFSLRVADALRTLTAAVLVPRERGDA